MLKELIAMTVEEIKIIEFRIDVARRCQARMRDINLMSEQYFSGMVQAYQEILEEFGGTKDAKEAR
jgi:hypothetical protein